MSESGLLPRLAAAASVVGHLALVVAILLYAGVRPFEIESPRAIAVDLVTPDEIKPPEQPPTPPEPNVKLPDLKPSVVTPQQSEPQASTPPQQQAAPQPQQQTAPEQRADAPQAAQQQQVQPKQQPQSPPTPAFTRPEPDLTLKYGVTLGLPDAAGKSDFDAIAADSAKLASTDIAAFRQHLKTCSAMPDTVTTSDDVWIKLRAVFTHDGRLAVQPVLIEGKASPKAIALAHGAIAALQMCQPYSMLPADKYNEWKVLDLEFSPKDFTAR
ncbi:MAG: cell envelope biogenesis protein TolA [Xanthobacteraceae bacterium]